MKAILVHKRKTQGRALAVSLALSGIVIGSCWCGYDYAPERMQGISGDAVWSGGPDGGVWLECTLIDSESANWCTAWDDQTGQVIARTLFVLRDSGEPVAEEKLKGAFFSGLHIHLVDGRALEPLRYHLTPEDELPPAPIDPPR